MAQLAGFRSATALGTNPPLPRTIGRRGWAAYQHALRDAADRESAGLPQHPANDLIDCPDCDGAGEHVHNDSNPHGYGPDPQEDYTVTCARCNGDGSILDGHLDPLVLLRRQRYWLTFPTLASAPVRRMAYRRVRNVATERSWGFCLLDAKAVRIAADRRAAESQARMESLAQGCVDATRSLRSAMERAA